MNGVMDDAPVVSTPIDGSHGTAGTIRADLDRVEMDLWRRVVRHATPGRIELAGLSVAEIGGAVAVSSSKTRSLTFNRVVGLGVDRPASERDLDRIVGFYRTSGSRRFVVRLSPHAMPEWLPEQLAARNFVHVDNGAASFRPVTRRVHEESAFRVREIEADAVGDVVRLMAPMFEWPVAMEPLIGEVLRGPDWRLYVAFAGESAVAAASLAIRGGFGFLGPAATLPGYRGQGAQAALMDRRMADAAIAGCEWLVAETPEDRFERPSPAFRNTIRAGFEVAFLRRNYVLSC